jgi:hypothetical protein
MVTSSLSAFFLAGGAPPRPLAWGPTPTRRPASGRVLLTTTLLSKRFIAICRAGSSDPAALAGSYLAIDTRMATTCVSVFSPVFALISIK